jgi:hypothetical protein
MSDAGKQLCCCVVWFLIWILGITFSWVYKVEFSSDEDSTSDIALVGAVLYTFSIFNALKAIARSNLKECCESLALLVAFIGGFVLPIIAAILLAVGAAKTTDTSGRVIASMAAAFDFLSVPVNCAVWIAVVGVAD